MVRGTRRDLKKEALWRRMLRGQAKSGLSVRAWCRRQAVRESAFYWWRTQLSRRDREAPTFVPVHIRAESCVPAGRIEIVLAGDHRVQMVGAVDRQALADVLAVLASAAPQGDGVRQRVREAWGC